MLKNHKNSTFSTSKREKNYPNKYTERGDTINRLQEYCVDGASKAGDFERRKDCHRRR